jgi:hypothetical protein
VGPSAGLDVMEKRTYLLYRDSNSDSSRYTERSQSNRDACSSRIYGGTIHVIHIQECIPHEDDPEIESKHVIDKNKHCKYYKVLFMVI